MMTKQEFYKIKQNGKLVAIDGEWQYWLNGNAVYYLNSDGNPDRAGLWCILSQLRKHLFDLRNAIGQDWLKRDTMYHIDYDFWKQYSI